MMRSILLASFMGITMAAQAVAAGTEQTGGGDRVVGGAWAGRSPVIAMNGMAATSQPLASQVALDILKAGGNAMDAAIAANAAIGLMEPTGNGIGGDIFAIVWDPKTKQLYGLNGSGRSPMGLDYAEMKARIGDEAYVPRWGSLSVSVPGTVDGWYTLHEKFGKLDMAQNLAPAISYSRQGFPVSQVIGFYFQANHERFGEVADIIEEMENYEATYLPGGVPLREGQVFRNPDLADTLEKIANGGRDAFYEGDIARTMDAYMKRIGGPFRYEDFAAHRSEWIDPVSVNYRGYDVWELPPNGQGIAALQMLNILEAYDLKAMGHNSADYLHVQTEAKKLVFEDRARFYADMAFYDVPLAGLLSKEYSAERRKLISMERAATEVDHGDPRLIDGDTIYMTVADSDGMMVSLIQSNYAGMGSGLVPDGLGFMFQNRGALFSMEEGHPNVYAPGKRPFHTIIPAFVTKDGEPFLSFGLMGGAMQPMGHVQIVNNIVDFGMNVQEAGDAARYHHAGSTEPTGEPQAENGGVLQVESGVHADVIAELQKRGHEVEVTAGPYGGYQAILWDKENGVYWGATEMRKDGAAQGY